MLDTQIRSGGSTQSPTGGVERLADLPDSIEVLPVQLWSEDGLISRGLLYKPRGSKPKVGVHVMHPRTDVTNAYYTGVLASRGYAVLARGSRSPNNDADTIHEELLLDVAAGVKYLRQQGCEQVVLLGSSGGSSLAAFYQAQATASAGSRLRETPGGEPLDLNLFDLPPIAGIAMIAGHGGEGECMHRFIDPSVVDEADPLATDPSLDMYNPANGFVLPPATSRYSEEFLVRYREAQTARVKRLDVKAHALIDRQREALNLVQKLGPAASSELVRAAHLGHVMIIYRTSADPAYTDLSIDPDDRIVNSLFSSRPDLENYGGEGFGRYLTPRAWLSTWSMLSSNARTGKNIENINVPLLFVHYTGDAAVRLSDAKKLMNAGGMVDKKLVFIPKTTHFAQYIDDDGSSVRRNWEGVIAIAEWLEDRFPV